MGLVGAHKAINPLYNPVWLDWIQIARKFAKGDDGNQVGFDLFGCMFYFIKKQLFAGQREALLQYLVDLFKQVPNITVVMEGARSQEKFYTAQKRQVPFSPLVIAFSLFPINYEPDHRFPFNPNYDPNHHFPFNLNSMLIS